LGTIVPLSKLTDRRPAPQCGPEREKETATKLTCKKKVLRYNPTGGSGIAALAPHSFPSWLLYTSTGWFSTLEKGGSDDLSRMLLLSLLQLLVGLDCVLGAPAGREVYRMPQSALKGKQTLCLAGDTWGH
jgi:hypothetical protein